MANSGCVLERKVVWLTGASSGIGAALAKELAERGARLVLSARRENLLEEVRGSLERSDQHLILPLDMCDPEAFAAAEQKIVDELGPVDVLLLNAGISQRSFATETDISVDRRLMEVDYFGPVGLTKQVLPAMIARGQGRIVVVTSLVGRIGTPMRSGYAAAKHALHGFFESLRAEIHSSGVRITLLCPGFVLTELPMHALKGDGSAQGSMDRAQLEGMRPEECASRMVRAIEQGRDEVNVAGREGLAVWLFRFLPALFRRLIRRVKVT